MQIIHQHYDTLSSTNDFAKKEFPHFSKDSLTIISASMQTNGRGKYERVWFSPPDMNLYVTFCFFKEGEPFFFTRLMSEVLQEVLKEFNLEAVIKWPNDLLVSGKKIAGVLTEVVALPENVMGVAIGVGLNVNMPRELLEKVDQRATSFLEETGRTFNIHEILTSLTQKFCARLDKLKS